MDDFENLYINFFEQNRKYSVCNTETTKSIFRDIVQPNTIAKMIIEVERGNPAVLGIIGVLDNYCENKFEDIFKKCVGAYIAAVLQPFGYIKTHQKNLGLNGKYFSSGSCYMKHGNATKELIVTYQIRDIKKQ